MSSDSEIVADLAMAAVVEAKQAIQRKMDLAFNPAMRAQIGVFAFAILEANGRAMRKVLPSAATDQLVDELEQEALAKSVESVLDTLAKRAREQGR